MKQVPEISFVVVNFNGIDDTMELLRSMKLYLRGHSYEVIVVDNGSSENQADIISKEFSEHILIRNERNLGFSGGNNLGIKASSGKYIMLLNNDTLLRDDSVFKLTGIFERNRLIGAVSPKIYFMEPSGTIQYAGFTEFSAIALRNRAIGYNETDNGQHDTPSRTFSAHGAAMMLSREVVEKVGLMPEVYFLYYEEVDWCSQMKRAGYEIWYEPAASVIHKDGRTIGASSYTRSYYMTRNRMLYSLRNMKGMSRILSLAYQLFFSTPKAILTSALKGRLDIVKACCLGTIDLIFLKNKYS